MFVNARRAQIYASRERETYTNKATLVIAAVTQLHPAAKSGGGTRRHESEGGVLRNPDHLSH